jgi:hypothetical protein
MEHVYPINVFYTIYLNVIIILIYLKRIKKIRGKGHKLRIEIHYKGGLGLAHLETP